MRAGRLARVAGFLLALAGVVASLSVGSGAAALAEFDWHSVVISTPTLRGPGSATAP
jgi:hypothetical protein